ncbi:MAG: phosphoribosylanthranilate isomerase [Lachnospiraceae bacterium]|nr:phosphoribosylanthranilate isomerase [Lachnospiraceae bacterium]
MTKVKICGLKTLEEISLVNKYLPEYVGFVFAPSKRQVNDAQAKKMKEQLDPRIQTVGVFVNEPQQYIVSLCKQGILDVVQLHGEEDNQYIKELRKKCKVPIIKAIRVQNAGQVKAEVQSDADFLLFDTYKKESYGGSGEGFKLAILKQILEEETVVKPFFIAGGLTLENVDRVFHEVACYGVDVSSGVENDNKKDEEKVQKFIRQVREKNR